MAVSIIMPALDEAAGIVAALDLLQPLRARGHEVIVADAGSQDGTRALATPRADRVIEAPRGRALQMNAGAALARHSILLFLHADTLLPPRADEALEAAIAAGAQWGRFNVRLSGSHRLLRVVETGINWRSALTGVATGDQAMFVTRAAFQAVGGFDELPLMEDVALSKKLRRRDWPCCLRHRVITSSRRWEDRGILRTVLLMWRLRAAYWLGADPRGLAAVYHQPLNMPKGCKSD